MAALLAALMLLGAGATTASAAPVPQRKLLAAEANQLRSAAPQSEEYDTEGALTITTPGTATAEIYIDEDWSELWNYDLSGLVIKAESGKLAAAQTAEYDVVTSEAYYQSRIDGKINWSFHNDDGLNFLLRYKLEAGKTYYLLTSTYYGGDYTVTIAGSKKADRAQGDYPQGVSALMLPSC